MAAISGTTLAYIALATTLASAGVSAYSAHEAGKAEKEMGVRNAQIAGQTAANEAEAATENAKRIREQNRRQLSMIRAKQAAGGTQVGTGSALDVIGEAGAELELQALDLFRQSDAKIRQLQGQGDMSMWQGSQAATAGNTQAIGSLLSGLGSAAGSYGSATSSGAIGGTNVVSSGYASTRPRVASY